MVCAREVTPSLTKSPTRGGGQAIARRLAQAGAQVALLDIEALRDPKYKTQPGRFADKDRINGILKELLVTNTTAHWVDLLSSARIPCAPVNKFSEALSDPQVLFRNMVVAGSPILVTPRTTKLLKTQKAAGSVIPSGAARPSKSSRVWAVVSSVCLRPKR